MRGAIVWVLVGVVVGVVTGCGLGPQGSGRPAEHPTAGGVTIDGDASDPRNQLAMRAIADLQSYWAGQFRQLYGTDYRPVDGGFYATTPSSGDLPPCAASPSDVSGNAYYCPGRDVLAWDAENLLPYLQQNFGDFAIPVVMAHEWGHAIQARADVGGLPVTRELQADCFAGAWARHARDDGVFDVTDEQLDTALAGVLDLEDTPGTSRLDPNAHGSGFDRVGAFGDGYDAGLARCREYRDGDPVVLDLPFTSGADQAAGGDAPYASIVAGVPADLQDYWSRVYPEIAGGAPWRPVARMQPHGPADPPSCGGRPAPAEEPFYCAPEDYVAWDDVQAMPRVYQRSGDYAVATLLATQFGRAVLTRLGDRSGEPTATLRGDCFAGSYTASVILHNRKETSAWTISPGDLDEGIKALLTFGGGPPSASGFDRVRAFREGVLRGAPACVTYGG